MHTVILEVEWDSLAAVADMCERCLDNFHWVSAGLALANAQGLTIDVIYVGVDSGWTGPDNVDTILFSNIQVNNVIRFPAWAKGRQDRNEIKRRSVETSPFFIN